MPVPIYETISNYHPSNMFPGKIAEVIKRHGSAVDQIPGMAIMKSSGKTFATLFDAFVQYIHNSGNGMTWQGSSGGGTGHPFLDGKKKRGECLMFARALKILASSPEPYGLNLKGVGFVSYSGPNKMGFVSAHDVKGVVKLRPNVEGENLYFWANHKVVTYAGRFYDPMYNKVYNSTKDMVAYAVMENEAEIDGATYYPTEDMSIGDGQGFWFKEGPPSNYFGPSTVMPF